MKQKKSKKRTLDQNAMIHAMFKEISDHLILNSVDCSPAMAKELAKMLLGNTTEILSTKIAMPTSSYKQKHSDLTLAELNRGYVAMDRFIIKIIAWAETDLNLELKPPNEELV